MLVLPQRMKENKFTSDLVKEDWEEEKKRPRERENLENSQK